MTNQLTSSSVKSWIVFGVSAVLVCYVIAQMALLNSLSSHLIAKFNLNAAQLSHISTAYLYACIIAVIPAGYLIDKLGIRKPSLFSIGINIIGLYLLFTATHFSELWLSRFLCGLGNSIAILAPLRIASTQFSSKLQAICKGLTFTAAMLGGALAQGPFIFLSNHFSIHSLLYGDLLLGIFILALVFIFTFEPKNIQKQLSTANENSLITNFLCIAKNSRNWFCGIYTGIANLAFFILGALWGNLYLQQAHGVDESIAAHISSLVFYGTIIGSPLLGWASNLLKNRLLLMKVCGAISATCLALLIYTTSSIYVTALLFFLLGIANGGQLLGYIVIAESNDPNVESIASGFVSLLINIFGALFQLGFGWLIQSQWNGLIKNNAAWYSIENYHYALTAMLFMFLISIVMPFFMRETFNQKMQS